MVNKVVDGKECTILWHVNDIKVSHVDSKVVEEVLKLLKTNPPKMTPAPPLEDRTAKGLQAKEK